MTDLTKDPTGTNEERAVEQAILNIRTVPSFAGGTDDESLTIEAQVARHVEHVEKYAEKWGGLLIAGAQQAVSEAQAELERTQEFVGEFLRDAKEKAEQQREFFLTLRAAGKAHQNAERIYREALAAGLKAARTD